MAHQSAPEILVPHTVRVLGHATTAQVASLRSLPPEVVEEHLEDARALGLVDRSTFGTTSWHLTDRGRAKGEADLAEELDTVDGRPHVTAAHARFLPLNRRIGTLVTQWQLRPTAADALAANDHRGPAYDDAVIRRLARLRDELAEVTADLTAVLQRFDLHQPRFDAALRRAEGGANPWVDGPEVASMNLVWIQLHEDLLATLGLERGQDDVDAP